MRSLTEGARHVANTAIGIILSEGRSEANGVILSGTRGRRYGCTRSETIWLGWWRIEVAGGGVASGKVCKSKSDETCLLVTVLVELVPGSECCEEE